MYLEVIAVVFTSSLYLIFSSQKKGEKNAILWDQNNDMKSKGADEKMLLVECFDILSVLLKKYIILLFCCKMGGKGSHYSEIICRYGVQFSAVLKCAVAVISNVQGAKV